VRCEIPFAARLHQRLVDLGAVGEAVHDDVETRIAEVFAELLDHAVDAEITPVAVALLRAKLLRRVQE
jgi:hypothetical protein